MMGHIRLKPLKFWPKHMTHPPAPQTIWTLTNGMAGFEVQTSAIAQTLAARLSSSADLAHNPIRISRKIINPPLPYRWLAPYGPAHQPPDCAPPYPDILVASGRKTIPLARHIKRASKGTCFTIILQNPRRAAEGFDLVWAPAHDGLSGANVVTTLLSPHGLTPDNLAAAAQGWQARLLSSGISGQQPISKLGVVIGGANKIYDFATPDQTRLTEALTRLAKAGHFLMITLSRRSPDGLAQRLRHALAAWPHYLWAPDDGQEDNPYRGILGLADQIIVTGDSVNMVGEACVTGAPVYLFPLAPRAKRRLNNSLRRFTQFHQAVCDAALVTQFDDALCAKIAAQIAPPIKGVGRNSTGEIVDIIIDAIS